MLNAASSLFLGLIKASNISRPQNLEFLKKFSRPLWKREKEMSFKTFSGSCQGFETWFFKNFYRPLEGRQGSKLEFLKEFFLVLSRPRKENDGFLKTFSRPFQGIQTQIIKIFFGLLKASKRMFVSLNFLSLQRLKRRWFLSIFLGLRGRVYLKGYL